MSEGAPRKPNWDRLYEAAGAQDGYFTTQQAADAGYSSQLLLKHIHSGRVARTRRGVYRLVHFPAGDHEELAVVWLWSERKGVFSHQTALALHGLSDVLPGQIHVTLPAEWRHRRFRVPQGVVLHHAGVPPQDRVWFGPVPVTSPRRTLRDCATEAVSPELLRQAAYQALRRGLVVNRELPEVEKALRPFGGLAT
jgi:predicted transcriptional regulator of viral defense system